MTIVQHQISLQVLWRLWHLPNILLYCLFCHKKCHWTSTWTEFFLWKFLVFLPSRSVDLWLYHRAATLWILGRCSTRIQSALHWFRQSFCNFEKLWSNLACSSKIRWHLDVDGSFQYKIQNMKRLRPFCAGNLWLLHHQSMTYISMNDFPNQVSPIQRSHLVRTLILKVYGTLVSMWDLLYFWSNDDCPSNSSPWILMIRVLQTWTFTYHRMFFSIFCNIHRRPFLSFPHLIIHPVEEWSKFRWQFWFCFIVSKDELLWPCYSLKDHNADRYNIP